MDFTTNNHVEGETHAERVLRLIANGHNKVVGQLKLEHRTSEELYSIYDKRENLKELREESSQFLQGIVFHRGIVDQTAANNMNAPNVHSRLATGQVPTFGVQAVAPTAGLIPGTQSQQGQATAVQAPHIQGHPHPVALNAGAGLGGLGGIVIPHPAANVYNQQAPLQMLFGLGPGVIHPANLNVGPHLPAATPTYRTIIRNPNPARFPPQYARPRVMAPIPPPASNMYTVRANPGVAPLHGAQLMGKPPHNATPPPGDIFMNEIMMFNPNWVLCSEVAARSVRNGHTVAELVDMFFASGVAPSTNAAKEADMRIRQQRSMGSRMVMRPGNSTFGPNLLWDSEKAEQDLGPQTDLTAASWEVRSAYDAQPKRGTDFVHMRLDAFWATVPINTFPTGVHEGVLTKCLRWAFNNRHLYPNLDTSHFQWIIDTQGF
ncbi:hypothetical protein LTS10_012424 [Elasticomyces elasticus]|nr:hypothetical protein LTS10_012424 [Elasticomyces elasticus]